VAEFAGISGDRGLWFAVVVVALYDLFRDQLPGSVFETDEVGSAKEHFHPIRLEIRF